MVTLYQIAEIWQHSNIQGIRQVVNKQSIQFINNTLLGGTTESELFCLVQFLFCNAAVLLDLLSY